MRKHRLPRVSLLTLALLLLTFNSVFAQIKTAEDKKFSDKIFFGGSLGMVFGTVTRIDILPEVGVWVLPQWAIGVGGRYTFRKERSNLIGGDTKFYSAHIWGLSGFTDIMPIRDLDKTFKIGIHGGPIFHAQWEGLYLDKSKLDPTSAEDLGRGWVNLILVGAGYRFPMGEKAGLNFLVLWDLTNNKYSPYTSNPLLRINITF